MSTLVLALSVLVLTLVVYSLHRRLQKIERGFGLTVQQKGGPNPRERRSA